MEVSLDSFSQKKSDERELGDGMFCGVCNILDMTVLTKVNMRRGIDCREMNW